ncbi:AAA family ATPase [Actinoplanes sp. CA-054009]
MRDNTTAFELLGRRREREALDGLLRDVGDGRSRVLALQGEAGVGKSALLDYLVERAGHSRVVRAAGVELESDIAYSALQQLCAPLLPHLGKLPDVQGAALSTAFGLTSGTPPEMLLLGMAVLGLFSEAAADKPLVCVVDDVQWLDRHSGLVLAFVARRLDAESVGLVLAARTPGNSLLKDLPELRVGGLGDADAHALLDSVLVGSVDSRVRDRIVAETHGNPLALLELPKDLSPAELAFGFGGHSTSLAGRVEDGFRRRIGGLPDETRRLMLAAAVEPVGDVPLLWRALDLLGVGADAAGAAAAEGLLEVGSRVRFRHPLVRSASWRSADPGELRRVHAALAEVTDPGLDPDRRAWHRAHAAVGPDEEVAGELVASADRALARGGRSAAASFLERAAILTPDPKKRAVRTIAAARARLDAGATSDVPELLAAAELGPLGPLQRADLERVRAKVAFAVNPGSASGPLHAAAGRLADLDEAAARQTYLEALGSAVHAGRLGGAAALKSTAEAARGLPAGDDPAGLFLTGLVTWSLDGYAPAVPRFAAALDAVAGDEDLDLLWLAAMVALEIYDDVAWDRLARHGLDYARRLGALPILLTALSYRTSSLIFSGRFADAQGLADESITVAESTGRQGPLANTIFMAAHRGREAQALELIATAEREVTELGVGRLLGITGYAKAVLYNGLGNFEAALKAARFSAEYPDLSSYGWSLSELVEAASRAGDLDAATEARDRLAERATAAGTPWALGARELADALTGPAPEQHYRAAIEHLGGGRLGLLQARARLLYGEWLRRSNRRGDARTVLRAAHEAFATMGAEAFEDRAGRELVATGETVRKRSLGVRDDLTPQEAQIARRAIEGLTNPEIAAALFLSPRTVEWHLRKIFNKLGITSRRELAGALGDSGRP